MADILEQIANLNTADFVAGNRQKEADVARTRAQVPLIEQQTAEAQARAEKEAADAAKIRQQAQRDERDAQILQQAHLASGGDPKKLLQLAMKASPGAYIALQKSVNDAQKSAIDMEDSKRKVLVAQHARLGDLYASVLNATTESKEQAYQQFVKSTVAEGLADQTDHSPTYPGDQAFTIGRNGVITQAALLDEGGKKADQATKAAEEARKAEEYNTKKPVVEAQARRDLAIANATVADPKLLTPEQRITQDLAQKRFDKELDDFVERVRHNKADEQETARYHNMSIEGSSLTPEAKSKMAEMFATTGALPTLGTGKAAAQTRSEIINQAAKDFPQVDFATNKAAFQANQTSLRNLQKQQDSIESFEKTAGKNLDQFLATAKGVIDSGSPLLNKPLRVINERLLGSGEQQAFSTARQVAVTEIAKVLNNPNGVAAVSDSARHEIQTLVGPDATLKQIYRAADILRTDMKNRRDSGADQIKAIGERIKGSTSEAPRATHRYNPQTGAIEAIP